ncbi:MAG: peptide chain release factor N(5)-glutamine methyltransferase [Verrucomicrobiota bacterium JB023]|nr:peptide chain release factor N(5)-glutamine methyltransferase [Verrucomicrobiota bacterium JB023]
MRTLLEVLERGTEYLSKHGIEDARLNMQLLLGHHLALNRMQLYLNYDRPLSDEELEPIRVSLKKRSQRIPLQHLLGSVEFHGREFKSDERALIPRPETEELVSLILSEQINSPTRFIDVGTGSGVIGITLAEKLPEVAEAQLADFSPSALALARENAAELGNGVKFIESDLLASIEGSFDLIVANLPYIPDTEKDRMEPELSHDPGAALFSGADGLNHLRRLIADAPRFLNPGGLLALEIGHDQGAAVTTLLEQAGLREITLHSDLSGIPRFPFARK